MSATCMTQLAMVPCFRSTSMCFNICSYRYKGMAVTYFFISTAVTTEVET